ncbi:MAG: P-loop NTPase fold protein, partial [Fibrobacterota bacterium]
MSEKKLPPHLEEPQVTLLNDSPIDETTDLFNCNEKLRPLYDTLRHQNTQCPLTIAVTGKWGTGKTSSMRFLKKRLEEWTLHTHGIHKAS